MLSPVVVMTSRKLLSALEINKMHRTWGALEQRGGEFVLPVRKPPMLAQRIVVNA